MMSKTAFLFQLHLVKLLINRMSTDWLSLSDILQETSQLSNSYVSLMPMISYCNILLLRNNLSLCNNLPLQNYLPLKLGINLCQIFYYPGVNYYLGVNY